MLPTAQIRPSLLQRLACWWRDWSERAMTAELDCRGPAETARIARGMDAGGTDELRVLAGKWPDALDPLSRRMWQIERDGR